MDGEDGGNCGGFQDETCGGNTSRRAQRAQRPVGTRVIWPKRSSNLPLILRFMIVNGEDDTNAQKGQAKKDKGARETPLRKDLGQTNHRQAATLVDGGGCLLGVAGTPGLCRRASGPTWTIATDAYHWSSLREEAPTNHWLRDERASYWVRCPAVAQVL